MPLYLHLPGAVGQRRGMDCFNGNAVVTWAVEARRSLKLFLCEAFIVSLQKFLCTCWNKNVYFVQFLQKMGMQRAVSV